MSYRLIRFYGPERGHSHSCFSIKEHMNGGKNGLQENVVLKPLGQTHDPLYWVNMISRGLDSAVCGLLPFSWYKSGSVLF